MPILPRRTALSAIVEARAADAQATIGRVTARIRHGDHPVWQQEWASVLALLEEIRRLYAVDIDGAGNLGADLRVESFFDQCHHFLEWLWKDPTSSVSKHDAMGYRQTCPALIWCGCICNSTKHYIITSEHFVEARIRETEIGEHGIRVIIEIDWARTNSRSVDALALAEDCVASWRAFFAVQGITDPMPPTEVG